MDLRLTDIVVKEGHNSLLSKLSLSLESGRIHALLGPVAAGKTSLLRCVAGLQPLASGEIWLDTHCLTKEPPSKRGVAMVYQQFINYPSMSVFDNIAAPLRRQKISKDQITSRVNGVAKELDLEGLLNRRPHQLSGGQQQRTALARALVQEAKVLLLDEPFVNLDVNLRESLRHTLQEILVGRDCVVLYATTEAEEALILGGTVSLLYEGRLLQHGGVEEVFRDPITTSAAAMMTSPTMNFVEGRIFGNHLSLDGLSDYSLPDHFKEIAEGRYVFGIRPDQVRPSHQGPNRGVVDYQEVTGSHSTTHVKMASGGTFACQTRGVLSHGQGDDFAFDFDTGGILAFSLEGKLVKPARLI